MPSIIKPPKLCVGDSIGIIAPCIALKPEYIKSSVEKLVSLGFHVELSKNLFSNSYGFSGSIKERVDDFHAMIQDPKIKLILFGGGEVCNEMLPYIDYTCVSQHPKIICSYSDSTTLLNAIHYMTGLVTFYGASLRTFEKLSPYNWQSFSKRLMGTEQEYIKGSNWKVIYPGGCIGRLAGGYLVNFAALQGLHFYPGLPDDSCLLFIEDHEMFSSPAVVSKWFANLEQRGVFEKTVGLLFGHYSNKESPLIDEILYRIGYKYCIPVVRCEDFGHGANNSILPIGIQARLDTNTNSFEFLENAVI